MHAGVDLNTLGIKYWLHALFIFALLLHTAASSLKRIVAALHCCSVVEGQAGCTRETSAVGSIEVAVLGKHTAPVRVADDSGYCGCKAGSFELSAENPVCFLRLTVVLLKRFASVEVVLFLRLSQLSSAPVVDYEIRNPGEQIPVAVLASNY